MTAPPRDPEATGGGGLIPPLVTSAPTPRSRSSAAEAPLLPPFLARLFTGRFDEVAQDAASHGAPVVEQSPEVFAGLGLSPGESHQEVSPDSAESLAPPPAGVTPDAWGWEASRISADPAGDGEGDTDFGADSGVPGWDLPKASSELHPGDELAERFELTSGRSSEGPEEETPQAYEPGEAPGAWTMADEGAASGTAAEPESGTDSTGQGWAAETAGSASEGFSIATPAWSLPDEQESDESRFSEPEVADAGDSHSWLDADAGGAAGPVSAPSWRYEELPQPTDDSILKGSSEPFADVGTSSFVAGPAESDATGIVEPPGADQALGMGAETGGEIPPAETADSEADSADSGHDTGWVAAMSQATERADVGDSPAPEDEATRARELADRLEKIARTLREKGVSGPVSGDSPDPLGALITGYMFGLAQGQTRREGKPS